METSSVIILDSDSDDGATTHRDPLDSKRKLKSTVITTAQKCSVNENGKRTITAISGTQGSQPVVRKRIKPTTVASNVNNNRPPEVQENFASIVYSEDWEQDMKQYQKELAVRSASSTLAPATPTSSRSSTTNDELEPNARVVSETVGKMSTVYKSPEAAAQPRHKEHLPGKNPIGKEFQQLLDACRKADPSKEMETLIEKKLVRYYEVVHPDYVNSKSFRKAVAQVTADVLAHPTLVFLKLSTIVEELNVRRKSRPLPPQQPSAIGEDNATFTRDSSPSSGSTKKDRQIAKLNRTLYCLTKRIQQLEQADVDFNHEINSAYLMAERYKKRAFEVYEKLCDITGESKNAHRVVRKPIHFEGTPYPDYNRILQMFVNQTNTFPNFRDVLKCLQHCNKKFGYGLRDDQMNQIAQDAFIKIGGQLQKRRKTDLYETVVYHTGDEKDPALNDPKLREELSKNGKHYGKVNQLIARYAQDDHIAVGEHFTNLNSQVNKSSEPHTRIASSGDAASQNLQSNPSSSHSGTKTPPSATTTACVSFLEASASSQVVSADQNSNGGLEQITDTDEEEEDEDDDEEEDEFESTTKENVRPDNFEDIVISDDEELLVPES